MATILAHITIREGSERAFEKLAADLHKATHATEDNVRAYGYWRAAEPRHYYTLLAFTDYLSFIAHQTSDHHETAGPELGRFIESIRLEWVDPIVGASTLGPTEMQAAPDDADELTKRYIARSAAQIADWWLPLRQ